MKTIKTFLLTLVSCAAIHSQGAIQATKYYVDNKFNELADNINNLTQYIDGSNVVFTITNYVSGTYTTDYAKLRILEFKTITNTDYSVETKYSEVYNSKDDIQAYIDNFENTTFNTEIASLKSSLENKADQAWGKYMSSGGSLEEMGVSNTIYMTAGHVVFAGDTAWERVAVGEGCIWALVSKGARTYTTGDESTFKFQDEGGTNYFGFAKTDSYILGCNTDGIDVTGEGSSRYVTLTYDLTSSTAPSIYYSPTITEPITWEKLNNADGSSVAGATYTVQWEQNPPLGKMMCYITVGTTPQGFFRAELEVPGEAKFITNMPADLQGGILASNETLKVYQTIYPVIRNGSIVWEAR
jgi:hypothetical protein